MIYCIGARLLLETARQTFWLSVDLPKTFDMVNYSILLDKLYNYGIRGGAYALMESCLYGKRQKVRLYDIESDYQIIITGVPQGTILGPLVLIILGNNILVFNADDTAIISMDDTGKSR